MNTHEQRVKVAKVHAAIVTLLAEIRKLHELSANKDRTEHLLQDALTTWSVDNRISLQEIQGKHYQLALEKFAHF